MRKNNTKAIYAIKETFSIRPIEKKNKKIFKKGASFNVIAKMQDSVFCYYGGAFLWITLKDFENIEGNLRKI